MEVQVLGTGCSKCRSTVAMIGRVALAAEVDVDIVKVENPPDIHRFGVSHTTAVVIGAPVVHDGGIPSHAESYRQRGIAQTNASPPDTLATA